MTRAQLEQELRELISQKELAKMLGVSVKTLCEWNRVGVKGRTLPKVRRGGRVFYRPEDVSAFRQVVSGGK